MGANQSKPSSHRWKRNRSHIFNPAPASANLTPGLAIDNNNSNSNNQLGANNVAVNSNPNINLGPGASAHYAPVNNFYSPVPDPSNVIQTEISAALKERHVPNATYDAQPGHGCMEGTRVHVLQDIEDWIMNTAAQQIFWLAGMAGMGKTAIAQTVCAIVREHTEIVLGGSFFCSRSTGSATQRDIRCVVPTLAQLMARQSTEFSTALATELKRDPDILHKQIGVQMKQLLFIPLLALKDSPVLILFVIDALDECGDQPTGDETANNTESHRIVSEMLAALIGFSRSSDKLPVKFLVTSRPETHIRDTPVSDTKFSSVLHLHTVNKEQVTADIRLYISTRLSSSPKLRTRFTDGDAEMLAGLCDGLFIVATTALTYALGEGIDATASRFKTLLNSARDCLSSGAAVPLDRMYEFILLDTARLGQVHSHELNALLQLLASLLSTQMVLSVTALAELLAMDKDSMRMRLSRLHAVVHVPDDDNEPSLRTLHASFGDYLMGRAASHIRITSSLGHEVLARGCFHVMVQRLYFNVSQSRSSYEQNSRTRPHTITLSLEYACLQWIRHVAAASVPSKFDEQRNDVFRSRFLFWLEVFSMLGQVWHAAAILYTAASTVRQPELSEFLRDANVFVTSTFEAIHRSAPHIYISALPFASKDSLVYQEFAPLCTGLISVETFGKYQHDGRLLMNLTGHKKAVYTIAYSPDGSLIGSGSQDGTVRVWDTRTGEEVMPPMLSGTGWVRSVAFAPNGRDVAAGTDGGCVYIWSISTSQGLPRRLGGHSGIVYCVTFSPDGALLASASKDETVCLWNVATVQQIANLKGHTGDVHAVVFSPDGKYLASCSGDETIRLWHIPTGEPAGLPLLSSGDEMLTVCFSPDGTTLASGGSHRAINLWDIQNRTVRSTLRSHRDWIRYVRFSSDGKSLVSASDDSTIRLWDVSQDMGNASSIIIEAHTGVVYSTIFSPNGMYIASASEDCTVRIWNAKSSNNMVQSLSTYEDPTGPVAVSPCGKYMVSGSDSGYHSVCAWDIQTGEMWLSPLVGHGGDVLSVTISLDGRVIASGSKDHTVRLWDAESGVVIGEPLNGHGSEVHAVAFSSDSRWLASGSSDKTVLLWDVTMGKQHGIAPLQCDRSVEAVSFSPDGRLLAACDSTGRIHFWQPETGRPLYQLLHSTGRAIRSIEFSPDGERVVSGGWDGEIRVWNIGTRKELLSFGRQRGWVHSVTFSPNGQLICTGSSEQVVQLWNASTGDLISTLHGHTGWVRCVAFTPDEQSIVSCSDDMTIRVWDVSTACSQLLESTNIPLATLKSSTLENRWLVGPSDELLVWVSVNDSKDLQLPPCKLIINRHRVSITIDSGIWHRGESWTSCWRQDPLIPIALTL